MRINADKIKLLQQPRTQQAVAEKAGLSRQAYNTILTRGTCHPNSLIKIAKALDVEPEELIRID